MYITALVADALKTTLPEVPLTVASNVKLVGAVETGVGVSPPLPHEVSAARRRINKTLKNFNFNIDLRSISTFIYSAFNFKYQALPVSVPCTLKYIAVAEIDNISYSFCKEP